MRQWRKAAGSSVEAHPPAEPLSSARRYTFGDVLPLLDSEYPEAEARQRVTGTRTVSGCAIASRRSRDRRDQLRRARGSTVFGQTDRAS